VGTGARILKISLFFEFFEFFEFKFSIIFYETCLIVIYVKKLIRNGKISSKKLHL